MSIFKRAAPAPKQVESQLVYNSPLEEIDTVKNFEVLAERRTSDLADADKYIRLDDSKVTTMLLKYIKVTDMTSIVLKVRLRDLLGAWRTWDEGSLGMMQQADLYRIYAVRIPEIIRKYFQDHQEDPARIALDQVQGDLAEIIGLQVETPEPIALPGDQVGNMGDFPTFAVINSKITDQLAELELLWRQAVTQVTTVEDKFFLDQIIETYLPDVWRMFRPFAGADGKTRNQAVKLVEEQLALLTVGVNEILDKTRDISLRELAAHKNFLQQRLSPQNSTLALPE